MLQFDKNSTNCIAVMYPTGGYGNFLYYLLSKYFSETVKFKISNFKFSDSGDSHVVEKYTEVFNLGRAYSSKNLKNFSYNYRVADQYYVDQINLGKKFVVLCDMGNLGDNVNFLKKYFPNAKIIRVFANTFDEKLILWANAISKSYIQSTNNQIDPIYKTSFHSVNGIAAFSNKSPSEIVDRDAIECTINFFKNNFELYGKMFSQPADGVINLPFASFFNKNSILAMCNLLEQTLNLELIKLAELDSDLDTFLPLQKNFALLDPDFKDDSIISQAIRIWKR